MVDDPPKGTRSTQLGRKNTERGGRKGESLSKPGLGISASSERERGKKREKGEERRVPYWGRTS